LGKGGRWFQRELATVVGWLSDGGQLKQYHHPLQTPIDSETNNKK
jgi:hypothetical protein